MAVNAGTRTLVGVFEDLATAQSVARELEGIGYSSDQIRITGGGHQSGSPAGKYSTHGDEGGGIGGWFRRVFGADDEDTGYYDSAVQSGRAVVTVEADEARMDEAVDIMNRHGAVDVNENARSSSNSGTAARDDSGRQSIPVVKEELLVGKRAVQRGGVRVYSRVTDQPVEEKVTLREEHVRVERTPVDRPLGPGESAELRDQTIEVTETSEEPVITKRARVVEEVSISKETTERTETVRDNVRRTDVKVEKTGARGTSGGESGYADYDTDFRQDFRTRYGSTGGQYETYAPAYQYGYTSASDARYKGKSWSDVESTLKTDYERNNPNSTWDNMKGAIRYGWEKVTGKR